MLLFETKRHTSRSLGTPPSKASNTEAHIQENIPAESSQNPTAEKCSHRSEDGQWQREKMEIQQRRPHHPRQGARHFPQLWPVQRQVLASSSHHSPSVLDSSLSRCRIRRHLS